MSGANWVVTGAQVYSEDMTDERLEAVINLAKVG